MVKKVAEKKVEVPAVPAVKKSIEKKKAEPAKVVEVVAPVVEKKKREKKEKKEKDPNAPKRPLSAFFLFAAGKREGLDKDLAPTDKARQLGALWKTAKAENDPCVAKYQAEAVKLREAYHAAMEKYKASIQ